MYIKEFQMLVKTNIDSDITNVYLKMLKRVLYKYS